MKNTNLLSQLPQVSHGKRLFCLYIYEIFIYFYSLKYPSSKSLSELFSYSKYSANYHIKSKFDFATV